MNTNKMTNQQITKKNLKPISSKITDRMINVFMNEDPLKNIVEGLNIIHIIVIILFQSYFTMVFLTEQ